MHGVCWFFLFSLYSKIYCFQKGSVQTKCNHPLHTCTCMSGVEEVQGSPKVPDWSTSVQSLTVLLPFFPVIDCSDIYM